LLCALNIRHPTGVINNVPSCEAWRERSALSSRFRVRVTDRFNLPMVKHFSRYHEVKARFDRGGKCAAGALTLSRSNQSRRCENPVSWKAVIFLLYTVCSFPHLYFCAAITRMRNHRRESDIEKYIRYGIHQMSRQMLHFSISWRICSRFFSKKHSTRKIQSRVYKLNSFNKLKIKGIRIAK